MTPLLWTVARCEVGGTVAAGAVWAVTRLAGRQLPPRWRYNLWLLVLLRLCLPVLPMIPVHLPRWTARPMAVQPPSQFEPAQPETEPGRVGPVRGDTSRLFPESSSPTAIVHPSPPFDPVTLLVGTWAVVAAGLLARLAVQTIRTSRLVRSYPPLADAGLLAELSAAAERLGVRPPSAVVAPAGTGPAVTGLLRPRLLLPADFAARLPPDGRRLVLLHELTHVRRRDVPLGWLASAVAAAHWFNPAAWLALSQLRVERELSADAAVLDATGDRAGYGETLVRLLQANLTPSPVAASAMAEPNHSLHRRITMIARHRPATVRQALAAVAVGSAVLAGGLLTVGAGPAPATRPASDVSAAVAGPGSSPSTREPPFPWPEGMHEEAVPAIDRIGRPDPLPPLEHERLGAVIDRLATGCHVTIAVDWDELHKVGIDADTRLPHGPPARWRRPELVEVLRYVLHNAEDAVPAPPHIVDPANDLDFTVLNGVVLVGLHGPLWRATAVSRTYNVATIVGDGVDRQRRVEELGRYIKARVNRDDWHDVQDNSECLRVAADGKSLLIRQPPYAQAQVAALLDRLREGPAPVDLSAHGDVKRLLARHLPAARFNNNFLVDVVDFLGDVSTAAIEVDWAGLNRTGVSRQTTVSARLRDVSLGKSLELILKAVQTGDDYDHRLGYAVGDGVITISTRRDLDQDVVTREYKVGDLVDGRGDPAGRLDEVVRYLTENVEPASWRQNGGPGLGQVQVSRTLRILLVTQTEDNQDKVTATLDALRDGPTTRP